MLLKLVNGIWQTSLADVEAIDVLLTDPPYSGRTHRGQRTGSSVTKSTIGYQPLTAAQASDIAHFWHTRTRHWAVIFCDHVAFDWHAQAWSDVGWYVFAPVTWTKTDPAPRMQGDGPTNATEYIMVARPRKKLTPDRGGHRRGNYRYAVRGTGKSVVAGQKPLRLIQALVQDYTLAGDIVADPYAGSGTTLVAAIQAGCLAVGAEKDDDLYEHAKKRILAVRAREVSAARPTRAKNVDKRQLAFPGVS